MTATDVKIENANSIMLLTPMTAEARQWIEENVAIESWQWIGGSVAVEPRCIEELMDGMREVGLQVN